MDPSKYVLAPKRAHQHLLRAIHNFLYADVLGPMSTAGLELLTCSVLRALYRKEPDIRSD